MTGEPHRESQSEPGLTLVSSSNFLRAYGIIAYLAEELQLRGVRVHAYAPIPLSMMPEAQGLPFRLSPLARFWPFRPRRFAHLLFRASLRLAARRGMTAGWLFTDLAFYRDAVVLKRRWPHIPLIHLCAELMTPEEFPWVPGIDCYARNAGASDLVIDLNPERAAKRRELFGLTQEMATLPNTMPRSAVPPPAPRGSLANLAGCTLPDDMPILVYAGGAHAGTGLHTVVKALASLDFPCYFLAFCHCEEEHRLRELRSSVRERLSVSRARVCDPVPRRDLLACLHEADAGLVYYPHSDLESFNQLYCAPAKLYEYLAVGLPVIGSDNPTLRPLIEGHDVGRCAHDDSAHALSEAIGAVLRPGSLTPGASSRAASLFANELAFEHVAGDVIDRITSRLVDDRR